MKSENDKLKALLKAIYNVATGEDQVAFDDTGGLEWIRNEIKQSGLIKDI